MHVIIDISQGTIIEVANGRVALLIEVHQYFLLSVISAKHHLSWSQILIGCIHPYVVLRLRHSVDAVRIVVYSGQVFLFIEVGSGA